ncbi:MAG: hypothetical protein J0I09_10465 [Sphingobacteriia bacterium]|nr:hypothetical protein [Sphingobacteriia bacterium]
MKENQIKGVIVEIVETKDRKSAFDIFTDSENIDMRVMMGESEIALMRNQIFSSYLKAREDYKKIIKDPKVKELLARMSELETEIIQGRCALATVTKLGMINQKRGGSETSYIIARAPFYNPDNVKAEIRVYLGKASEIGRPIEELSRDSKFMDEAERQIVKAMKEVMDKRRVPAGVKKSVSVKEVVVTDGEAERIEEQSQEETKKKGSFRTNPYQPQKGHVKPKPKGGGFPFGGL